jgi:hypothetical protein
VEALFAHDVRAFFTEASSHSHALSHSTLVQSRPGTSTGDDLRSQHSATLRYFLGSSTWEEPPDTTVCVRLFSNERFNVGLSLLDRGEGVELATRWLLPCEAG